MYPKVPMTPRDDDAKIRCEDDEAQFFFAMLSLIPDPFLLHTL